MNFEKLLSRAKEAGINEIEVYSVKKSGIDIETFNKEVDTNTAYMTSVMSIRGVYNGQVANVYIEEDSDEVIDQVINTIKDNASLINKDEPYFIYGGAEEYPVLKEHTHDFDQYDQQQKIALCLEVEEKMKNKSEYVDKTEASYSEVNYEYSIVNSNGLSVSKKGRRCSFYGSAFCQKGDEVKVGYDYDSYKNIKDIDLDKIAETAVTRAVKCFDAESVESKEYKVVLDNRVVAEILGSYLSIFSAENVIKNLSFLKDKIGEKVFGENITMIDDPLNELAPSQDSFDDEGVPCFTKTVVENGVLKTYLHNLKTASMMNTKSTGNASKTSVAGSVNVSPSNFYLKTDDISLEQAFEEVKDGLYITSVMGSHAGTNVISGSFSLQAAGFKIENGKVTDPVTLIIISGNIKDVLNDVAYICNDFKFFHSFGTGSLVINRMSVSGK